jgi:hypothetical protein
MRLRPAPIWSVSGDAACDRDCELAQLVEHPTVLGCTIVRSRAQKPRFSYHVNPRRPYSQGGYHY